MSLTIAKLAGRAGLSPDAVRYYERAGLLPAPERSGAGYRLYEERLLDRLSFIKGAQRSGLKLRQVRELLEIIDRGVCPCGHTESLLSERIAEVDQEVKELREIRKQLIALKGHLPSPAACSEDSEPWPCERAFIEVGVKPKGAGTVHGKQTG
jgi:DNA-binding transcriptional MerR regulator